MIYNSILLNFKPHFYLVNVRKEVLGGWLIHKLADSMSISARAPKWVKIYVGFTLIINLILSAKALDVLWGSVKDD